MNIEEARCDRLGTRDVRRARRLQLLLGCSVG